MDATTLKKLIGNLDKKELIKIIGIIANSSDVAEQKLLDYCHKYAVEENKNIIFEKQLKQHWKKSYSIIQMSNMYGGCPDSDEEDAYDEMSIMEDLIEKNHDISWLVRKEVLDELLEQIAEDNSGFTDYMVDLTVKLCYSKEEKQYLADFLSVNGSSYYKEFASRIYREIGEDQKYLASRKAQLNYGSDYLDLASYYKKNGNSELALQTVLEGLNKADGRLDDIYGYLFKYYKKKNDETAICELYQTAVKRKRDIDYIAELLYDYYKEKQDYVHQKKMLLNLIQYADSREIKKWYLRCRSELSEQDYIENEQVLLEALKKKNLSAYYDICIEKGKTEEILEYLKQHLNFRDWQRIDDKHRYSKALAAKYPQDIIELYWKEVKYFINLGKEKNYRHAVSVLREIRQIMKKNRWTEDWNNYYAKFLEENHRKKLLIKELEKF